MFDPVIIGAVSAFAGVLLASFAHSWRLSGYISAVNARAEAAEKAADDARRLTDEAHTRITALDHLFGIYRERVATEYVSKEAMRELKADLMSAIGAVSSKLDDVLSYERQATKP